jgi:hypothetical protein
LPPEREDVVALTAGARQVFRSEHAIVYERESDLPHVWIVHDVRPVDRGQALPLRASGAVDPYRTALIEGSPPETAQPGDSAAESATVEAYEPDRITIAARAAAPGLLVVSDIYASGWRAFVDGREVPVLATDHALRGIPLPAGLHTVEVRYDPISLRIGLIVTAVTLAAMLVVMMMRGWRAVSRPNAAPARASVA